MPKIVVRTPELKPHSCWYTRYSGEGTPDAASISTRSTATHQKAAGRSRRRRGTNRGKSRPDRKIPPATARRAGKRRDAFPVGAGMTQSFEIDLHSEYLRADLFLAMGQPIEAARILERVVAAEPENEAAVELLARAYFGSAQLTRAEEVLTRLVALAPANGWARRALARTLERQSRHGEAVAHHRMADALGAE